MSYRMQKALDKQLNGSGFNLTIQLVPKIIAVSYKVEIVTFLVFFFRI